MLTPLEVAAGVPLPARSRRVRLGEPAISPRAALEQAVLPALARPPCIVSFSGGRDSSLVLAVATAVARREGLPAPLPVTVRVARDEESDEEAWQRLVIEHLALEDWTQITVGDELDCLGPIAQSVLLRHGVLWPANVHFHVPQFEIARGGSLLTGIGGDEIFSRSSWWRLRRVATRAADPEPRDVLRLAALVAPPAVRRRVLTHRAELDLGWLRPDAKATVVAKLASEAAAEPISWRRRFEWLLALSYLDRGAASLERLAGDWQVQVVHPLLDSRFAAALASLPRAQRFDGRTDALGRLFGGLLPAKVVTRTSKAAFGGALWGPSARSFAETWDGSGVDERIVDVDALARRWTDGAAPGPYTLLQALWLERARAESNGFRS